MTTISTIYKDRWQIELFLKTLKQNLKVKTTVGTTENALSIHIWRAVIGMLLIESLQATSEFGWLLSNLVAFLRWNLLPYRALWEWIDHPFPTVASGAHVRPQTTSPRWSWTASPDKDTLKLKIMA